jgi:hypothetical protein
MRRWTRTYKLNVGGGLEFIFPTSDGNFILGTYNNFFWTPDVLVICIIADQRAHKDSLFTYKIPTYGEDTLNFGYTPLKIPSGMTVSPGGSISWTPKTDSVYLEHVEFLVVNDSGRKDTLTFNIFVNNYDKVSIEYDIFDTPPWEPR